MTKIRLVKWEDAGRPSQAFSFPHAALLTYHHYLASLKVSPFSTSPGTAVPSDFFHLRSSFHQIKSLLAFPALMLDPLLVRPVPRVL